MVSKLLYFVMIIPLCSVAWAEMPFQNESEKLSSQVVHPTAMIQPEQREQAEIADISDKGYENPEQHLKGSRSHLSRVLFRKPLLMVTQPLETFNISDDMDDDDDDDFGDDTMSQEDGDKSTLVEGVDFRTFFQSTDLFTELSYLPTTMMLHLQTKG